MYTESMMESIRRLEATREARKKQVFPPIGYKEKDELLKRYHPDYKEGMAAAVRVGPNKGDKTFTEFLRLFEAFSKVPLELDLSKVDWETDVLIIGGGGAGASAALLAQQNGAKVLLVTKLRFGDANTVMAQGGIQAADKPNDSPAIHYLDVMGGGHFKNDPKLVKALTRDAPFCIKWLEELGVMLDKEPDGTMVTIHGGGTSRKRMHSARDYSGAEIMRVLREEVRNRNIPVVEFTSVLELLTDKSGACTGAVVVNMETGEYSVIRAKTTILATGGAGRLHVQGFPCTNHYGATADGVIMAYKAGARFKFLDTIQYHPTGVAFPEQILGQLITEKVRGLGAHLVNKDGERFIYELDPRDVTSSALIRECTDRKKGIATPTGFLGVWLDSPMIEELNGPGTIQKALPAMYRQFTRFNIDMTKVPILTYPTQHYQNGGVAIDEHGETEVKNLFAAGEVTGGVHGRNRLMGNSLLDIVVFGRRAGAAAANRALGTSFGSVSLDHVKRYHEELRRLDIPADRKSPMILPDYREKYVQQHQIQVF